MYVRHHFLTLTKSSRCTFSQHFPFQSLNNNTRVGRKRCLRLIKKTLARQKSIVAVDSLGLKKAAFRKASKCPL